MPNKRSPVGLFVALVCAAPLAAQEPASCSGPGVAFGVMSYQCASCAIKQSAGARTQYVFQAEPIVLQTTNASVLKPGDVIEAINGEPILTLAGSDQFTYPRAGKRTITVRRGSARAQLTATIAGCEAGPNSSASAQSTDGPMVVVDDSTVADVNQVKRGDIETVEVLKGALATSLYGPRAANGVIVIKTKRRGAVAPKSPPAPPASSEPLFIVDGVPVTNAPSVDTSLVPGGRRYGFAIGCLPSCTRARARDGAEYYKFDGYPPVVALTHGGSAERMGIRVGDLVTEIDGKSILGEEGALRFFRDNRKDSMHVAVLRDGARVGYLLKTR